MGKAKIHFSAQLRPEGESLLKPTVSFELVSVFHLNVVQIKIFEIR